ncbi:MULTISPECIES: monovalent cation:proton antiporter-2 (CPA2) family protein [Brucella/Ochrobactrum group]|uniref:Putative Glutathione-regulated potassium-efflux system protein KefB n=1 Tax=Ochrobactrum soli TaxID=2448455 RepID=A0A2P9HGS7_9HYPH|nr:MULTISPECIES: monovalent cation:proton antiporter-2 (CPA2) family protein [Brucella]RRD24634.1 potassium transporter [Brucellaceae bacterium VT-16-1752]WHT43144.1 monovalent cation:proton antiporter-2 (CPA2) family protein [Ochrobactrum sp. SSR]MDX4075191.1 monovalent cation:proton antiporter-2 (CPA2) family protein [Brucella sp. NBRC 113783]RLL74106.1 potassium transporter [[Ochrobactrum] soli]WHS33042.1 monovalent cation:proton antiporter-2 (CPA2) family protein [Brucella sp. NM4]
MAAAETATHAAEAAHHGGFDLIPIVVLLGAAVIAVPLFKRLGLGSVLGYLAAGLIIGPFGLGLFSDPQAILHVAELGVVMFLFIIGLEMQPSRLWSMRGEIFGLGLAQVALCIGLLTIVGLTLGYPVAQSFVAGTGFVLTSTAIVMQMLEERRAMGLPKGRRIVAILLLEDLAIVPLLALVAFLAPGGEETTLADRLTGIAIGLASIVGLILAGRYLLDPLFRILGKAKAREVMTAAALFVVLGAALAMQLGGLSMAMGAFLAGVLLSESTFRHQLEADVEPFRGVLLGLFFLGVGMSLDLAVIAASWQLIIVAVIAYMLLKMFGIYAVARLFRASNREAVERAVLMAQGGEFAFVLYAAATAVNIIDAEANAILTATIIVSMALTPIMIILHDRLMPKPVPSMEDVETADNLSASVLLIGFGRFGQIVSQPLLGNSCSISIIETNTDAIRNAKDFGFKVYFGDGSRLDILHAAGAHHARLIVISVDDREASLKIAELVKAEFPLVPVLARSLDREHAIELINAGVEYQIRETFESALALGEKALEMLDVDEEERARVMEDVRRRDSDRLTIELTEGIYAGRDLIHGNAPIKDKKGGTDSAR